MNGRRSSSTSDDLPDAGAPAHQHQLGLTAADHPLQRRRQDRQLALASI
jgi:hypothetical protein